MGHVLLSGSTIAAKIIARERREMEMVVESLAMSSQVVVVPVDEEEMVGMTIPDMVEFSPTRPMDGEAGVSKDSFST